MVLQGEISFPSITASRLEKYKYHLKRMEPRLLQNSQEKNDKCSIPGGGEGWVWVRDSLVVSLTPEDLFACTLVGQGSQSDISYQTCLLGWSKPISLSNLPSVKEGWSKHYIFFSLRTASIWGFFLIIFQVLQGFVPE